MPGARLQQQRQQSSILQYFFFCLSILIAIAVSFLVSAREASSLPSIPLQLARRLSGTAIASNITHDVTVARDSKMARTPVYFLSHGGVSCI